MNYTLRQLEANLLKHVIEIADCDHGRDMPDGTVQWGGFEVDTFHYVDDLSQADGISFLCPKCFPTEAQHSIHVYFAGRNVPDRLGRNRDGKTVRWNIIGGSGLDDLQLAPSILMQAEQGCQWHGFVGSSGVPPGHAG